MLPELEHLEVLCNGCPRIPLSFFQDYNPTTPGNYADLARDHLRFRRLHPAPYLQGFLLPHMEVSVEKGLEGESELTWCLLFPQGRGMCVAAQWSPSTRPSRIGLMCSARARSWPSCSCTSTRSHGTQTLPCPPHPTPICRLAILLPGAAKVAKVEKERKERKKRNPSRNRGKLLDVGTIKLQYSQQTTKQANKHKQTNMKDPESFIIGRSVGP